MIGLGSDKNWITTQIREKYDFIIKLNLVFFIFEDKKLDNNSDQNGRNSGTKSKKFDPKVPN